MSDKVEVVGSLESHSTVEGIIHELGGNGRIHITVPLPETRFRLHRIYSKKHVSIDGSPGLIGEDMSTRKNSAEDRKQWIQAFWVAIVTFAGLVLLGLLSLTVSAWMPILFCWGGIMVFSAIPIIWMSLSANEPFPEIGQWSERIPLKKVCHRI